MAVFSPGKTNSCAGAAFYDLSTFFRLHHHCSTTMIMTTTTTTTAEAAAAGVDDDDDDDEKHDNNEEWVFRLICLYQFLSVEVLSVEGWGHGDAGSCELEHGVARQPCHVPIYCNLLRHTATYYSGSQIAAKQIGCFHQKIVRVFWVAQRWKKGGWWRFVSEAHSEPMPQAPMHWPPWPQTQKNTSTGLLSSRRIIPLSFHVPRKWRHITQRCWGWRWVALPKKKEQFHNTTIAPKWQSSASDPESQWNVESCIFGLRRSTNVHPLHDLFFRWARAN